MNGSDGKVLPSDSAGGSEGPAVLPLGLGWGQNSVQSREQAHK